MSGNDRETPGGPQEPGALVDYQPGGIVSRVVLRSGGGSVTLFAFDAGQELSEHSTPHEAMIQVLEGAAGVRIADESHRVETGRTLHLPAGIPHAVRADERFKMMLTMLRSPADG